MKTKKKNLLIVVATAVLLFVCMTFGIFINNGVRAQGNGELTLIGGEIEEEYLLDEIIEIPAAQLAYNGETKDAEVSVIMPSGERVRSAKVKLTEGGEYKVVFKALFGGKAKTLEKTFTANIPLFSKTSAKTSWGYGVDDSIYQTGKEGVQVRLTKGDTLTYNDIIDLEKSNGQIIDFFLLPQSGVGTKDVKRLVITLTDLYDPKVALTIILQCANDHGSGSKWWFDWTYVLAGGQNQTPTGVEGKGTNNEKKWVGGDWGSVVAYSFYGTRSNGNGASVVGTESLNVSYNVEENAVYVGATEIIRLDDLTYFEDPWYGFSSNEVKMTLTGENFTLGSANLMITRIGANNLKNEYYEDKTAPAITVDFGGYDENNLPTADKVFGDVEVKTTVYYNYESQQRYQVDIKDGRFVTDTVGYYTIEYLAYDGFKNESKKLVTVYCGENAPAITAKAVGEYVTSGGTGELIFPAEIGYEGGTGDVITYATAKLQGGEEFVIDEGFRPEEEGVYKINLYAVDMLGKTATFEYDLTVTINEKPVFLEEPNLPRYLLVGYKYTLPTISAYDYSSGTERKEIETTIAVKDGQNNGEVRDLEANVTDFVADADGYATIIYKATGAKGSNTSEYKIKVVNTWRDINNYSIDLKKYFYGENIEVTDSAESVMVKALEDTSYTFINPVVADGFETRFSIIDGGFECLQLVFEDSVNPNVRFTVEIDNSQNKAENAPLRINGVSVRYRPWAGFYDGNDFYFAYDKLQKTLQVDTLLKQVIINADGSVFEGFPSGRVYVTVNVIGVEDGAKVAWKNYGGQILSEKDYDIIAPSIELRADYASQYSINTVAEIYSAIAVDVLSPEVYTTMTVKDPNGEIVTDVDGLRLENVPFDRSYFINLEMYGSYSVKYSAMDFMERKQEYPFALLVVDDQAPVIKLSGSVKTNAKQGDKLTIVKATAKDNVDAKVDVYAYLVDPNGIISKVNFGKRVTLNTKGVYELRYLAIDEFGNLNILCYKITVR